MEIIKTDIPDCYVINNSFIKDKRGTFSKIYSEELFKKKRINPIFQECYYSISYKNIVRGMHFQIPPYEEDKLIFVTAGEILDVVLDIRKNSPKYKKSFNITLNHENKKSIYAPKGLAHGFLTLSDFATVVYLTTANYSKSHDKGIKWNSFGFDWGVNNPIISERDMSFKPLSEFKTPFIFKRINKR